MRVLGEWWIKNRGRSWINSRELPRGFPRKLMKELPVESWKNSLGNPARVPAKILDELPLKMLYDFPSKFWKNSLGNPTEILKAILREFLKNWRVNFQGNFEGILESPQKALWFFEEHRENAGEITFKFWRELWITLLKKILEKLPWKQGRILT